MCCVVVEVSSRAIVTAWLFLFNDTATTEIYTLSLHDALPISARIPELLLMIEKVPSSMIFDAVPRLQHKGFRWAPRSFLQSYYYAKPTLTKSQYGAMATGIVTNSGGLLVTFPGLYMGRLRKDYSLFAGMYL